MEEKKRILIVDDEKLNRNILADILKHEYKVILAKDGEQAWVIPLTRLMLILVMSWYFLLTGIYMHGPCCRYLSQEKLLIV